MLDFALFADVALFQPLDERLFHFLVHTKNGHLVLTFCAFVAVQFLFAALYFILYRKNRQNFSFNSDIQQNQSATVRTALENNLPKLQASVATIEELGSELSRGVVPVVHRRRDSSIDLPSGRKCVIEFFTGPPAGGPGGCVLNIYDSEGALLAKENPKPGGFRGYLDSAMWVETADEWMKAIPHISRRLEKKLRRQTRQFESLSSGYPDVWSYWDFVYFSTILQTTVGFGDILPNSTTVRMIVVIQILIGYVLLVLVLNIILNT